MILKVTAFVLVGMLAGCATSPVVIINNQSAAEITGLVQIPCTIVGYPSQSSLLPARIAPGARVEFRRDSERATQTWNSNIVVAWQRDQNTWDVAIINDPDRSGRVELTVTTDETGRRRVAAQYQMHELVTTSELLRDVRLTGSAK